MIAEQKCPNCGGALIYDPKLKKLRCEFCDSVFDIQQPSSQPAPQVTAGARDQALAKMQPLPVYICVSCGAEVITPAQTTGALTCPYCSNNIVLTQQFSGTLQPDGIIPFAIMPDHLSQAVQIYYQKKKFLPKGFFSQNKIGRVTGVYVPFWVFDADVSGSLSFSGEKLGRVYEQGDVEYTEHDQYQLERNVSMSFQNLALDASKKMDNDLMDAIQPYDLSKLVPFDIRYLAGFVADRFDEASSESRVRSDARMKKTAANVALSRATDGFSAVTIKGNHLTAHLRQAKYVLLPVYLLNLTYDNKEYHFAVNGQTGQVKGELPYSKKEERIFFWKRFAIGAGAMAAVIALIVLL